MAEDEHATAAMLAAKSPRESETQMTELVLPQHGNALGTAFGGTVLAWMDVCGAIAAQRHCHRIAVTAGMDDVTFRYPIRVADVVVLTGRVTAAFTTSLEVEVVVEVEDPQTAERRVCVDAFMTFVAVDENRQPVEVPALAAETPEDERRAEAAVARRAARLARRKAI
jgi:acyl-CoA hydrolase